MQMIHTFVNIIPNILTLHAMNQRYLRHVKSRLILGALNVTRIRYDEVKNYLHFSEFMLNIFCIYDKYQYDIRSYFLYDAMIQIHVLVNLQPFGTVILPFK